MTVLGFIALLFFPSSFLFLLLFSFFIFLFILYFNFCFKFWVTGTSGNLTNWSRNLKLWLHKYQFVIIPFFRLGQAPEFSYNICLIL
jgi:hypothetical protein